MIVNYEHADWRVISLLLLTRDYIKILYREGLDPRGICATNELLSEVSGHEY